MRTTIIKWREYPAEKPPKSPMAIQVLTENGEMVMHVHYSTKRREYFSKNDGKVIAFALPSDITNELKEEG